MKLRSKKIFQKVPKEKPHHCPRPYSSKYFTGLQKNEMRGLLTAPLPRRTLKMWVPSRGSRRRGPALQRWRSDRTSMRRRPRGIRPAGKGGPAAGGQYLQQAGLRFTHVCSRLLSATTASTKNGILKKIPNPPLSKCLSRGIKYSWAEFFNYEWTPSSRLSTVLICLCKEKHSYRPGPGAGVGGGRWKKKGVPCGGKSQGRTAVQRTSCLCGGHKPSALAHVSPALQSDLEPPPQSSPTGQVGQLLF